MGALVVFTLIQKDYCILVQLPIYREPTMAHMDKYLTCLLKRMIIWKQKTTHKWRQFIFNTLSHLHTNSQTIFYAQFLDMNKYMYIYNFRE